MTINLPVGCPCHTPNPLTSSTHFHAIYLRLWDPHKPTAVAMWIPLLQFMFIYDTYAKCKSYNNSYRKFKQNSWNTCSKQDNLQLHKTVSNSTFHSKQLTEHAKDTYWGKLHENGGDTHPRKVLAWHEQHAGLYVSLAQNATKNAAFASM